jgi:CRISPR-associated protein (TIGR02584 family)
MDVHADRSEEYARRVLLVAMGLSPQIVTETHYALAVKRGWTPTEIKIITTRRGADSAQRALLSDDPGWFRRLSEEYRLPTIKFGIENIHIIAGQDQTPLDDIVDDAANGAVADFITEKVRVITADPGASLHVSIAGGRKTMGFYMGYALSLFGRPQDRLSHVLISPPFESLPEFFYPAPHTRVIYREGQALDAKNASVHLGDIPFVRLRDRLPKRLLVGGASFSEAVDEAQKALPPLSLRLEPTTQKVVAGGKAFDLEPMQFALYWMVAEKCKAARDGVCRNDENIGRELLQYYGLLVNPNSGPYERTEKAYRRFSTENFDQTKAKVNRALKHALDELARPYLIGKLDRIQGSRAHRFGLSLPPEVVAIAPASLPERQGGAAVRYGSPSEIEPGQSPR